MSDQNQQSKEKATANEGDAKKRNVFEEFGDSVERFATKTIESIKETIDKSLNARNTVLTIRVNDQANQKLNMLVDAGIFKSRSESAAFLIEEGIKHQAGLFEKIAEKLKNIEKIKNELKDIISDEMSASATAAE
jgi:Arc/MetJ-type ribon-helix-helix transcriptional regulator